MKALAFPRDANPYQELLYGEVRRHGVIVTYLEPLTASHTIGMLLIFFQLIYYRFHGYSHVHLHWTYFFRSSSNHPVIVFVSRIYYTVIFLFFLLLVRCLGYKLIWTLHNLIPHHREFINDLVVSRVIAYMAHAVIVHATSTVKQMKTMRIRTDTTYVVPMGSYNDLYENTISAQQARSQLHIRHDRMVYGYFGRIEQYKGVLELIEAFNQLNHNNSELIIAGACTDEKLRNELVCNKKSSIHLVLGHIPDHEVQLYVSAADILVYPFRHITNSSSIMLAFAFKRPVLVPRLDSLSEIPEEAGIFYEHSQRDGLLKALQRSYNQRSFLPQMGLNGYRYSRRFTWQHIAGQTVSIYRNS